MPCQMAGTVPARSWDGVVSKFAHDGGVVGKAVKIVARSVVSVTPCHLSQDSILPLPPPLPPTPPPNHLASRGSMDRVGLDSVTLIDPVKLCPFIAIPILFWV